MDKITFHEIKAFKLMYRDRGITTSITVYDYHKATDDIILLAEKIKAERVTIAMTSGNG